MQDYGNAVLSSRASAMEKLVKKYFDGCNEADVDKMASCFCDDAVHYFPPGMYDGPFRGSRIIAQKWRSAVNTLGSYWTIDRLLIEPAHYEAVLEWSHFKTKYGTVLRGIEWYEFDDKSGLIKEIRAYYASPQAKDFERLELGGFDYAARGYPMSPPQGAR